MDGGQLDAISRAASLLGRRGASKGGKARARRMSAEERQLHAAYMVFCRYYPDDWREHLIAWLDRGGK